MSNILLPHIEEAWNENTIDDWSTNAQVFSLLSWVNKKLSVKLWTQQYDDVLSLLASPLMNDISIEERGNVYNSLREHIQSFKVSHFEGLKKFISLLSLIIALEKNISWFKPQAFIIPEFIKRFISLSTQYFYIEKSQPREIVQKIIEISFLVESSQWLLEWQPQTSKDFLPWLRRDMIAFGVEKIFSLKEFWLLMFLVSEMPKNLQFAYRLLIAHILINALNQQWEESTQKFMITFLDSFDIKEDECDIIAAMKSKRDPKELHKAFLHDFWERDNTTVSLWSFVLREIMNVEEIVQHLQARSFDRVKKEIEKYEKNKMVNVQDLYYTLETAIEDYIETLEFPKDFNEISWFLEFCSWAYKRYEMIFSRNIKKWEFDSNPFSQESIYHKIHLKFRVYIEKHATWKIKGNTLEEDFDGVAEIQEMLAVLWFSEKYESLIRELLNHKFQSYVSESFKHDSFDILLQLCTYFAEKNKDDILFRNFWFILKHIHQKYIVLANTCPPREFAAFKVWMQKIIFVSRVFPELHELYWENHIQPDTARYSSLTFWGKGPNVNSTDNVVVFSRVWQK